MVRVIFAYEKLKSPFLKSNHTKPLGVTSLPLEKCDFLITIAVFSCILQGLSAAQRRCCSVCRVFFLTI